MEMDSEIFKNLQSVSPYYSVPKSTIRIFRFKSLWYLNRVIYQTT